jgi:hypothetical protein
MEKEKKLSSTDIKNLTDLSLKYIEQINLNFLLGLEYYLGEDNIKSLVENIIKKYHLTQPSEIYHKLQEIFKKVTSKYKWQPIVKLSLEISRFTNK